MTTLEHSIEINAEPSKVFDALVKVFSSSENFKIWHKDHIVCQWLKGRPLEVGSVVSVEEFLHGKPHKLKFVSTQFEPNERVQFKALFPASIICTGGSFVLQPKDTGCVFRATLSFNAGWLFSVFAKTRVDAIKKHMKEEGENLKVLLEADGL